MLKEILLSSSILSSSFLGSSQLLSYQSIVDKVVNHINESSSSDLGFSDVDYWVSDDKITLDEFILYDYGFEITLIHSYNFTYENDFIVFDQWINLVYIDYSLIENLSSYSCSVNFSDFPNKSLWLSAPSVYDSLDLVFDSNGESFETYLECDSNGDVTRSDIFTNDLTSNMIEFDSELNNTHQFNITSFYDGILDFLDQNVEKPGLFNFIGLGVSSYVEVLISFFINIVSLFYVADSGFTILGILLLVGICFGIVKWAFNLIKGLVRK